MVVSEIIIIISKVSLEPCNFNTYFWHSGSFDDEPTCGRPLGMRFDKEGKLIVIDTYLGLYKLDVDTGRFLTIFCCFYKYGA